MKIFVKPMFAIYRKEKDGLVFIKYCTSLREFDDYLDLVDNPDDYLMKPVR